MHGDLDETDNFSVCLQVVYVIHYKKPSYSQERSHKYYLRSYTKSEPSLTIV